MPLDHRAAPLEKDGWIAAYEELRRQLLSGQFPPINDFFNTPLFFVDTNKCVHKTIIVNYSHSVNTVGTRRLQRIYERTIKFGKITFALGEGWIPQL
jgi:hypothetical protein